MAGRIAGGRRIGRRLLALALVVAALAGCGGGGTATPLVAPIVPAPIPVNFPPATAPGAPVPPPTPLIGQGKRVAAGPGGTGASAVVDGEYCAPAGWRAATFPAWLAIEVGAGPSELLVSWHADAAAYSGERAQEAGLPAAYTLAISADSTDGADGTWTPVATITGNAARTRAHRIPFAGASWVRLTVAAITPDAPAGALAIEEIDIHDSSAGLEDGVFFLGDSITVGAHRRCASVQPSYAALVAGAYPDRFPAMIDGGISGVTSAYGLQAIDRLLADNPDYRIWAIAYGTNDAFGGIAPARFARQMQGIIDRIRAAGKEPVLARIPYTAVAGQDEAIRALNAEIDRLTATNGLRPGPDLYGWFAANPADLAPDGIHPEYGGAKAISRLWFEALRGQYEGR